MFRVVEVGAGAGGLTKDALPLLDAGLNAELLQFTATDVTNAFSGSLLDAVKSPKLQFKVTSVALMPTPAQRYHRGLTSLHEHMLPQRLTTKWLYTYA